MARSTTATAAGPSRGRRIRPAVRLFAHDRAFGERYVAGADEAGRGCLAGPLVAAAVCLDLVGISRADRRALGDLDDSKRLDAEVREELAARIIAVASCVAIVSASPRTIDRDGLHRTNLRLLAQALERLGDRPDLRLVDGFGLGPSAPAHRAVIGGDRRSAGIAAASILAKTTRDRLMAGPVARDHPEFGFASHVGYATPEHHAMLQRHGLTPHHRRSFNSAAYPA